jgi:F0F1-type ATP synthase assembly protein I
MKMNPFVLIFWLLVGLTAGILFIYFGQQIITNMTSVMVTSVP